MKKQTKPWIALFAVLMLACILVGAFAMTAFAQDGTSQGGTTLPVIGNDGKAYATIAAAITGAGDAEEIDITLAGDITENLDIRQSGKTITIDLAGHNHTGLFWLNAGKLIIKDTAPNGSSGVVNGKVALYKLQEVDGCSLEIYGGTFNGEIENYGTTLTPINIYGGTFNNNVVANKGQGNGGTLINIYGGTFHNNIKSSIRSEINIYDGAFYGNVIADTLAEINIYDGYFIGTEETAVQISNDDGQAGHIYVHGGFFEYVYFGFLGKYYDEDYGNELNITVNNGLLYKCNGDSIDYDNGIKFQYSDASSKYNGVYGYNSSGLNHMLRLAKDSTTAKIKLNSNVLIGDERTLVVDVGLEQLLTTKIDIDSYYSVDADQFHVNGKKLVVDYYTNEFFLLSIDGIIAYDSDGYMYCGMYNYDTTQLQSGLNDKEFIHLYIVKNVTEADYNSALTVYKTAIVDLCGYRIEQSIGLATVNNSNLTVVDSMGDGSVNGIDVNHNSICNINGGTINKLDVGSNATANINGGTVKTLKVVSSNGTANIKGSTVTTLAVTTGNVTLPDAGYTIGVIALEMQPAAGERFIAWNCEGIKNDQMLKNVTGVPVIVNGRILPTTEETLYSAMPVAVAASYEDDAITGYFADLAEALESSGCVRLLADVGSFSLSLTATDSIREIDLNGRSITELNIDTEVAVLIRDIAHVESTMGETIIPSGTITTLNTVGAGMVEVQAVKVETWNNGTTGEGGKSGKVYTIGSAVTTLNNANGDVTATAVTITTVNNSGTIKADGSAQLITLINNSGGTVNVTNGGIVNTLENSGTVTVESGGKVYTLVMETEGAAFTNNGTISVIEFKHDYTGAIADEQNVVNKTVNAGILIGGKLLPQSTEAVQFNTLTAVYAAGIGTDGSIVAYYSDVATAIDAGGTVRLIANVTGNVTIGQGKTITLDLCGHTITGTVQNGGTLTIIDTATGGTIETLENYIREGGNVVSTGNTLTVSGGTIETLKNCIQVGEGWASTGGTITVTGGTVTSLDTAGKITYLATLAELSDADKAEGTVTVSGGTVEELTGENAPIVIEGGTIESVNASCGAFTMRGGTLKKLTVTSELRLYGKTGGTIDLIDLWDNFVVDLTDDLTDDQMLGISYYSSLTHCFVGNRVLKYQKNASSYGSLPYAVEDSGTAGKYYADVQDAVAGGATGVKLLGDMSRITVPQGATITIDLGGKNVGRLESNGMPTIVDTVTGGTVKIIGGFKTDLTVDLDWAYPGYMYLQNEDGTYTTVKYLNEAMVSIGTDISMKISAMDGAYRIGDKLVFTMNEKTTEVLAPTDGFYVFTGITPQCMGDNIRIDVIRDGAIIAKYDYSVKKYLEEIATNYESYGFTVEASTLAQDMLIYGAAAQKYKNYKTATLITEAAVRTIDPPASTKTLTNDAPAKFIGATLWFDNVNRLRFYFETDAGIDVADVTAKINGKDVSIVACNGGYRIETDGIYASEFGTTYTAELIVRGEGDTTTTSTLIYSVYDYVIGAQDDDVNWKNLVNALYAYGRSAAEYVAVKNG